MCSGNTSYATSKRDAVTIPLPLTLPASLRGRPFIALVIAAFLLFALAIHSSLPRGYLAYSTRPLWDHSEAPSDVLYHYEAEGLTEKQACNLHGWEERKEQVDVWDATIFSTEIDLLLIRLHELSPLVSRFFILESTHTFTGQPKPLLLPSALSSPSFAPYASKITYRMFNGSALPPNGSPWDQEIALRQTMTSVLRSSFPAAPEPAPVMLFSDVDELPSRQTVRLLKACEAPLPLHLGMRSYLYSFEWQEGGETSSWRASAVRWMDRGRGSEEFYRHGKVTNRVLADSGWHCSWCFRHLRDFVTKATGYSHVDRLGSRPAALLRPERIQKTVCEGLDMFGMLPEAYSFRDLFNKMRLIPSKSAVNLPSYVAAHANDVRYLLPGEGNCIREDAPK
ncbi:hypothetical protein JCM8547_004533 [Rhodosporidiobolus lusitaniae]